MNQTTAKGILILIALGIFLAYQILSEAVSIIQQNILPIGIVIGSSLGIIIVYQIYREIFFVSKKFKLVKESISDYTKNCNELNQYIEELKGSYVNIESYNYGQSSINDSSNFNFERKHWNNDVRNNQTHNCSLSVLKNADNQPIKYLIKYFDIEKNEDSLSKFEGVLNDFTSVEQGKNLLKKERDEILASISKSIPILISQFSNDMLIRKLGFEEVDISETYIPNFTFQYISAGGNSSSECVIKLDIDNLNHLINHLNDLIKWRKSVAGQRALMTSKLRVKIKERDNFTCCSCNLSTSDEPNLLLEIDHIVPLSKGGITSEDNLQTLCWKCNRTKGAKILTETI
jgi:hypothetical protein